MIRPIVLLSKISGLHLRVKAGTAEPIPGTGRFTLKQGKWFFFQQGRYVVRPEEQVAVFGSREKAVEWIKSHPRFGRDFQIAPDTLTEQKKNTAPGAASDPE